MTYYSLSDTLLRFINLIAWNSNHIRARPILIRFPEGLIKDAVWCKCNKRGQTLTISAVLHHLALMKIPYSLHIWYSARKRAAIVVTSIQLMKYVVDHWWWAVKVCDAHFLQHLVTYCTCPVNVLHISLDRPFTGPGIYDNLKATKSPVKLW